MVFLILNEYLHPLICPFISLAGKPVVAVLSGARRSYLFLVVCVWAEFQNIVNVISSACAKHSVAVIMLNCFQSFASGSKIHVPSTHTILV